MGTTRARVAQLQAALSTVTVNAQALAAADLCIGTVTTIRDQMAGWFGVISPDRSMSDAASRLSAAIGDVQTYRGPFDGMPSSPINPDEWDDLKHAIERAYDVMWAVEDVQGDQSTGWKGFLSWAASTVAGSVAAMPDVISAAVNYVTDTASNVVTKTTGGLLAGLLPLWPLVAVAAAVVTGVVLYLGPAQAKRLVGA
jgi:hypothetical protein